MRHVYTISIGTAIIMALLMSSVAQEFSSVKNHATEPYGQVNFPVIQGITITHSSNPHLVFLMGSLACRTTFDSLTLENHYYRSFVLSDFGITDDFHVSLIDIGIQEAVGGIGGLQPLTCNLYITDGTPFPGGFPNSLTLIGTKTVDVPNQAGTHFPIDVSGIAPAGSELVIEISIPNGIASGNKFFMGINDFGQTAPSYVMAPICGFTVPTPVVVPPGFPNQHYVMSVIGDTAGVALGVGDRVNGPQSFNLHQNYPNPFNPTTTIEFSLSQSSPVTLQIFNSLGEEITTLVSGRLSSGSHSYVWDAANQASGVYLYRLQVDKSVELRKMILMR